MTDDRPEKKKDDEPNALSSLEEQSQWFQDNMPEPKGEDERYQDALTYAENQVFLYPGLDPMKAHRIYKALIGDGGLRWTFKKRQLNWISGLAGFCSHSGPDIIADIVDCHSELTSSLYEAAMDQVDDFDQDLAYDRTLDVDVAKKRGAHLAPNLPIENRRYLTPLFISQVLRPYLSAMRKSLEIFWNQIETAHRKGQFLMFAPEGEQGYGIRHPKDGFDGRGTYAIPRSVYMGAFDLAESDLDRTLIKSNRGMFDPAGLRFLVADQIPEFCLPVETGSGSKRLTRPPGINFDSDDAPFLLQMRQLIVSGEARSVTQAAELLHDRDPKKVAGSGIRESKVKRLARRYWDTYPEEGAF